MSKIDIILEGRLQLLSPLAVVPPNAVEVTAPDGGKYKQTARRLLYRDSVRETVPVIPGSTIRGKIRRAAVEVIRLLNGTRMHLNDFHLSAIGGVKGAGKEGDFDVVGRSALRGRNPVLGLFGAGDPWMHSHALVEDAIPEGSVQPQVVGGVRSDDGRRDPEFFEKLTPESVGEWVKLTGANAERTKMKAEGAVLDRNLTTARKAKDPAAIEAAETAKKEYAQRVADLDAMSSNAVSMPIQHECIPTGVTLLQRIRLTSVTREEAGLLFAALNLAWRTGPGFGQHANLGYGQVDAEYSVSIRDAQAFDPLSLVAAQEKAVGVVVLQSQRGMISAPPEVLAMMDAFKAAHAAGKVDLRRDAKALIE
jgi:CRISPR type IV-associated protein Csf2